MTQYPAGLKLNDQLNEVLAGFFKYISLRNFKKSFVYLDII